MFVTRIDRKEGHTLSFVGISYQAVQEAVHGWMLRHPDTQVGFSYTDATGLGYLATLSHEEGEGWSLDDAPGGYSFEAATYEEAALEFARTAVFAATTELPEWWNRLHDQAFVVLGGNRASLEGDWIPYSEIKATPFNVFDDLVSAGVADRKMIYLGYDNAEGEWVSKGTRHAFRIGTGQAEAIKERRL